MHADAPERRPGSPKAEPTPQPTEADLSLIAREAVHQPPDARLDKQLIRMGLLDPSGRPKSSRLGRRSRRVAIDAEIVSLARNSAVPR
jgi:hypothetical protein